MQKDLFEFVSIECIVKPGSSIYHMNIGGIFGRYDGNIYDWKKRKVRIGGNYDMVNMG